MKLKILSLIALVTMPALAQAQTNYEIRLSAGAINGSPALVPDGPSVVTDGSANTSTVSAVPLLTSDNSHGVAAVSSAYGADSAAWTAFNGHTTFTGGWGWFTANSNPSGWLSYEFTAPIVINKYAFYGTAAGDSLDLPYTWTLEASTDGVSWVVLHSVTAAATPSQWNYHSLDNGVAYLAYRIVAVSASSSNLGTTEVKFIEAQPLP